ncbi:MAG: ABC transporter permease subunit [Bifidobacterium sp.]
MPSISGFGTSIGAVVGGSLLTEQVFSYPGVGQMLLQAVTSNDYALMQGIFLIITVTVLVVNFIIDLLYGIIDPRTRQQD